MFSEVQTQAAFAFATNSGTSTFQTYLNGFAGEIATANTSLSLPNDFYGFNNIPFNEIRITAGGNANIGFLDNLQFGTPTPAPVPEPSTYAMMALGIGALGLVMRRSDASQARRRNRQQLSLEF